MGAQIQIRGQNSSTINFTNLAYFFCNNRNDRRNTASTIFGGLVYQLLRREPKQFVRDHFPNDFVLQKKTLCSSSSFLSDILKKIFQHSLSGPVCLLIDALDECDPLSRRFVLDFVRDIHSENFRISSRQVKLYITSRKETDIKGSLSRRSHHRS
jgi:hypothetical protein